MVLLVPPWLVTSAFCRMSCAAFRLRLPLVRTKSASSLMSAPVPAALIKTLPPVT